MKMLPFQNIDRSKANSLWVSWICDNLLGLAFDYIQILAISDIWPNVKRLQLTPLVSRIARFLKYLELFPITESYRKAFRVDR